MAIFIESETTFIWNFERTRLNMIRGKTQQHNKGKTQIDSTNWRHDNWKRLNKIEIAHPLEKVFTWTKSLRHIPLFILACSYPLISWGGGLAITLDLSNLELHSSTLGNYLSCVLSFGGIHNGHLYSNLVGLDLEEE